jgi:peptidoglycan/LPS O-acetylase OafA/YrhL
VTAASGGFLGVSTFFTLSGFLITTLLVGEHRSKGSISIRVPRRRPAAVPAAIAALVVVVIFGLPVATADQAHLFGDMVGAVT